MKDFDILEHFGILPQQTSSQETMDEYERYCNSRPDSYCCDILLWWQSHASEYPRLYKMACDMMSVLAMSGECERVFSSVKLLLTDRRNQMKEDVIEASECLKSWDAAGIPGL